MPIQILLHCCERNNGLKTEIVLEQTPPVSYRVIDNVEELSRFGDEWHTFAEKCGRNDTVYLTHDWISIWWRHFGVRFKLNIVVISRDESIIGIFPLFRAVYKTLFGGFECLETIGAVNGNCVGLFRDEDAAEVVGLFFDYLNAELSVQNMFLKLDLVPDDSSFYKSLWQKYADSGRFIIKEVANTVAPYISLAQGWNEYYRSITPARRNRLHYMFRSYDTGNRIKYRQFSGENLDTGLKLLFEVHRKRWQSQNIKSPFTSPEYCEYYREIAETFLKNRKLHFSYLTLDGKPCSFLFSIIHHDNYYAMTVGRDVQYARFKVGHIHYWYVIREAFQRQLREFDFLRGDEAYKFKWANRSRKYQDILISGNKHFGEFNINYHYFLLRVIHFIRNKHSVKEIFSLTRLRMNNRKLKTSILEKGNNKKTG